MKCMNKLLLCWFIIRPVIYNAYNCLELYFYMFPCSSSLAIVNNCKNYL